MPVTAALITLGSLLDRTLYFFQHESDFLGGERKAHLTSLVSILLTTGYYFVYFLVSKYIRNKSIIRNVDLERLGYQNRTISHPELMAKYAGNLGSTSTMAALSVTMVLLSVAALFQTKLKAYDNFVAIFVCAMMTVASVGLLFAHELYDAILNPLFDPKRRFVLRRLGANFQAMGLILFIIAMLLAISTVSTLATVFSGGICCLIMTLYIEVRLIDTRTAPSELRRLARSHKAGK